MKALDWISASYRPRECNSVIPAAMTAWTAGPILFGLVAIVHELSTGATGFEPLTILKAYVAYPGLISFVVFWAVGLPYLLIYEEYLAAPRLYFVLGYALLGLLLGALLGGTGAALLFAAGNAANAMLFAAITTDP